MKIYKMTDEDEGFEAAMVRCEDCDKNSGDNVCEFRRQHPTATMCMQLLERKK